MRTIFVHSAENSQPALSMHVWLQNRNCIHISTLKFVSPPSINDINLCWLCEMRRVAEAGGDWELRNITHFTVRLRHAASCLTWPHANLGAGRWLLTSLGSAFSTISSLLSRVPHNRQHNADAPSHRAGLTLTFFQTISLSTKTFYFHIFKGNWDSKCGKMPSSVKILQQTEDYLDPIFNGWMIMKCDLV